MRVTLTLAALTGLVALGASQNAYAGSFIEKCYNKTYEQRVVSSKDKLIKGETHAWSANINDGVGPVVYMRHPKTVIRTYKYDDQYVLTQGDCRDIIGKPAGALYD
jgi:hypothetical protein